MARKVCIVGAGISAISVANNLSAHGIEVALVEQNPYPGGRSIMYGCKATDTCVRCGVCLVREAIAALRKNPRITCHFSSRPAGFQTGVGSEGKSMEVGIETEPNPIDWSACIECARCQEACPEGAVRKIPGWKYYIASEKCNDCGKCVGVCPVDAIRLIQQPRRVSLEVDGVVLAPGFQPFNPAINRKWGHGGSPRVLTGSELEELFAQEKYLPMEAKSLAFIQCVGSRSLTEGMRHCSRVCCAYALRMAGRLREQFPELQIDFFHMDIQHFGKNFAQFWKQVSERITQIAGNPINVKTDALAHPVVRYESLPDLACREKAYDLVVLANGICPPLEAEGLADLFGLDLDAEGFLNAERAAGGPRGLFVSGTAKGPMRIEECLEDASAVSRQVIQHLGARL